MIRERLEKLAEDFKDFPTTTESVFAVSGLTNIAADVSVAGEVLSFPGVVDTLLEKLAADPFRFAEGAGPTENSENTNLFFSLQLFLANMINFEPAIPRLFGQSPRVYPMCVRLLLGETRFADPRIQRTALWSIYTASFDRAGWRAIAGHRVREVFSWLVSYGLRARPYMPNEPIDFALYIANNSGTPHCDHEAECVEILVDLGAVSAVQDLLESGCDMAFNMTLNLAARRSAASIPLQLKIMSRPLIEAIAKHLGSGAANVNSGGFKLFVSLTGDINLEPEKLKKFLACGGKGIMEGLLERRLEPNVRSAVVHLVDKIDSVMKKLKPDLGLKCCCSGCQHREPEFHLKRCAKCKSVLYCECRLPPPFHCLATPSDNFPGSRECQKRDWPLHKESCKSLEQGPPKVLENFRTVALKYWEEHLREIVSTADKAGPSSIVRVDYMQGYAQLSAWKDLEDLRRNAETDGAAAEILTQVERMLATKTGRDYTTAFVGPGAIYVHMAAAVKLPT